MCLTSFDLDRQQFVDNLGWRQPALLKFVLIPTHSDLESATFHRGVTVLPMRVHIRAHE